MTTRELKRYKKKIAKNLPYPFFKRNALLSDLFCDIDQYHSADPDCTVAELTAQFGDPKEIALSMVTQNEAMVYAKKSKRMKIWICVAAVLAIGLAFTSYLLYRIYAGKENYYTVDYYEETIYPEG